jgi:hypothetical protein
MIEERFHPPLLPIGAAWMHGFVCGLKEGGLLTSDELARWLDIFDASSSKPIA